MNTLPDDVLDALHDAFLRDFCGEYAAPPSAQVEAFLTALEPLGYEVRRKGENSALLTGRAL